MRILTVCTSANVFGAEVITLKMLEGFKQAGMNNWLSPRIWTDGRVQSSLADVGVSEVRLPIGNFSKLLAWQPMWCTARTALRVPWLWAGWVRILRQFQPHLAIFTCWRQTLLVYPWLGRTTVLPDRAYGCRTDQGEMSPLQRAWTEAHWVYRCLQFHGGTYSGPRRASRSDSCH
jgi:hypothetical protein